MCNLPLPMPNIKKLRDNLNSLGFHITAFDFTYKNVTYSVLFEVSDNIKEVSKYYIALLTFVKPNDESLTVAANSLQFNISSITEFRHFFGIEYNNNLHDFLQQFYARFGTFVPECPRENQSKESMIQMPYIAIRYNVTVKEMVCKCIVPLIIRVLHFIHDQIYSIILKMKIL